ncbi:MAG TPA: hypothetical protein VLI69_01995 [Gammaproteobacteria bacterium]|nr:hypothetical protein [Gammaproteobacteria bacterium]
MKTIMSANQFVSMGRIFVLVLLFVLPLNSQAEYYLVYGEPVCDYCQARRVYYRPVHKVKVYKYKHCKKYYKKTVYHRRSHYSIMVYYPVPVYERASCGCCGCGGFIQPTYYWAPAPYRVYYAHPNDRLVANRYEEYYYDPSVDTGTADNDIY